MQLLNLDAGIDFGAGGNLQEFSPVGFAPVPDKLSTWSQAPVAELSFRLPPMRSDLRFTAEVFPYLATGRISRQDCWVFFNGLFVHFEPVSAPLKMSFGVTREQVSPRVNRLSFVLPNAASPKDMRLGDDVRMLGLAFVKLTAGDAKSIAGAGQPAGVAALPPNPPAPPMPPAPAAGRIMPLRPTPAGGERPRRTD